MGAVYFFLKDHNGGSVASTVKIAFCFPGSQIRIIKIVQHISRTGHVGAVLHGGIGTAVAACVAVCDVLHAVVVQQGVIPNLVQPRQLHHGTAHPVAGPGHNVGFQLLACPHLVHVFRHFGVNAVLVLLNAGVLCRSMYRRVIVHHRLFSDPIPRFPRQLLPALVFLQRLLVFVLSGIPLHVAPQAGISRVHLGKPCAHSAAQCTGRAAGKARFQCCKERILVEQRLGRFLVAHHSVNGFVGVGLHKGLHSIVRTAGNGVGNGRVGFPERLIAHLSAHPVRNGTGHRVLGVIRAHGLGKVGHTHAVDGPSCAKLCRCFQNSFFRALPRFVTGSHAVACAVGTQHRQNQRRVDGTHDQVLSRAGSSLVEEPPHIALACHSVRSQVFSGLVGIPAPLIQPFHAVAVVIRLVVELTTPDSFVGCPDELRVISCRFQLLVGVTPALNTPDHLLFGTGRQGRGQCARVLPDHAFDIFLVSLQIALHTPSGPFAKAQVIVRLHVKPGPVDFVLGIAHLFQIVVHVPGVFQHRHYTHAARVRCQVVHTRRKVCCAYSPAWQRGLCHQPRQLPVSLGSILPVVHRAVNVHSDTVVPLFPQLLHGAGILLHLPRRAHCHLLPVQLVAPAVHGIRKAQVVPCPVILQRRGI